MKEFVNATNLQLAPDWIANQLQAYDTSKLRLHLKRHRRRDQFFSGYCRYHDFLVVAAIHHKLPLPFQLAKPIGSTPNRRKKCGYDYVWQETLIATEEQALVWVAGHECWHFLCKTKQHSGNWETRANKFGFQWVQQFNARHPQQLSLFKQLAPKHLTLKPRPRLRTVYG